MRRPRQDILATYSEVHSHLTNELDSNSDQRNKSYFFFPSHNLRNLKGLPLGKVVSLNNLFLIVSSHLTPFKFHVFVDGTVS